MADTFVKRPNLVVGTTEQLNAQMGENDIGFATDVSFYNTTEVDSLLADKQPVGDYATNSALASGLALKADADLSNIPSNYDYVIESQEPTSANNYTWYRLYKSGWIEQGGRCPNLSGTGQIHLTGTYPVPMKTRWHNATPIYVDGQSVVVVATFAADTAITVVLEKNTINNSLSATASAWWSVAGYVIE